MYVYMHICISMYIYRFTSVVMHTLRANMLAIINRCQHVGNYQLSPCKTDRDLYYPRYSAAGHVMMCVFTSTSCRTYVLLYQTRLSIYTRTDSHARARTHVYTHNTHNSTHVLLIIFVSSFRISNSLFRTHVHMHNTW